MFFRGKFITITLLAVIFSFIGLSSPAFALTSNDLVTAGSIFIEGSIAIALVFLIVMALSLQIGRGYFLRILNKFTLRLGADIWWLTYVLLRDAMIFLSFLLGLLLFFPGTFQDYPIAVPFMPLAIDFIGAALLIKLYWDADENRKAYQSVTILLFISTILYLTGAIFVLETPTTLTILPSAVGTSGIWYTIYNDFSSQVNVNLSWTSFEVCFAILSILGLIALAHPFLHSRIGKGKKMAGAQAPAQ